MHKVLVDLKLNLDAVINRLQVDIPNDEPFGNAHSNWSFPGLTRLELVEEVRSIIDLIEEGGGEEIGGQEARLEDYVRRLQHLQQSTIPSLWANAGQAVSAFFFTLDGLRKALVPILKRDDQADASDRLKKLTSKIRSMEGSIKALEPRAVGLEAMLVRIEKAHDTADQLPADMESLAEARQEICDLNDKAKEDQANLARIYQAAADIEVEMKKFAGEAKSVLERCETAYSAATSVGLAAAFSERSSALSNSMWIWVGGLVVALITGSVFGSVQLHALSEVLRLPGVSISIVILNLMLSALSVGAPVWFAWLATKQIGQRFRLAEDYAFKASISRAYEGFRREAARFDKDMESKLLTSALTRFDELPLRLVETASHGSPWHELASSELIKQAVKVVPGFAEQVRDLASKAIASSGFVKAAAPIKTRKDVGKEE